MVDAEAGSGSGYRAANGSAGQADGGTPIGAGAGGEFHSLPIARNSQGPKASSLAARWGLIVVSSLSYGGE